MPPSRHLLCASMAAATFTVAMKANGAEPSVNDKRPVAASIVYELPACPKPVDVEHTAGLWSATGAPTATVKWWDSSASLTKRRDRALGFLRDVGVSNRSSLSMGLDHSLGAETSNGLAGLQSAVSSPVLQQLAGAPVGLKLIDHRADLNASAAFSTALFLTETTLLSETEAASSPADDGSVPRLVSLPAGR